MSVLVINQTISAVSLIWVLQGQFLISYYDLHSDNNTYNIQQLGPVIENQEEVGYIVVGTNLTKILWSRRRLKGTH